MCGSSARTDLYGGRSAMIVPTVTGMFTVSFSTTPLSASRNYLVNIPSVNAFRQQLERGHANRATLQVARKLVAYLLAVDKSGQPFQVRTPPPKTSQRRKKHRRRLASAA